MRLHAITLIADGTDSANVIIGLKVVKTTYL